MFSKNFTFWPDLSIKFYFLISNDNVGLVAIIMVGCNFDFYFTTNYYLSKGVCGTFI